MADTLLNQLSRRVASFIEATGITHKQLARLVGCDRSQLTSYLSTGKGLSAERALKLLNVLSSSRAQLEAKFGRKAVSSQIVSLQERGKVMKLDSGGGWVAGQSGHDPNGTDDITGVKTAGDLPNADDYQQETIDFLRDQQNIHRSAIAEIQKYLDNVTKGKINQGSTEPARKITDNTTSRTLGPRGDLLSDPAKLKEQLEFVRRERKKSEEQLELQAELDRERKLYWDARIKTLRKQDG
jgi:hypothetical protein